MALARSLARYFTFMSSNGFLSHVQADDDADGGRIRALAEDLQQQYAAITADSIDIFVDRSTLGWGDDWESEIEKAVLSTSFFIPVITPRYFLSQACRREFQLFLRKADNLGLSELILPLVWLDVRDLHESEVTDDLILSVKRFQWVDWRELRFEDRNSTPYRRAVAGLAKRLADIDEKLALSRTPMTPNREDGLHEPDWDADVPGTLDLVVAAEEAIPKWTETLQEITDEITQVGVLAGVASEEMQAGEARGKGNAARLVAARKFAQDVKPHAEHIEVLGNEFSTSLYELDGGIRAILTEAATTTRGEGENGARDFASSIISLANSSREGLGSVQKMVESITPVESMSRDMRPPLRQIRKGLTIMVEGQKVIDEWERLANAV